MATNFFIASTFRASDFSVARKFGTISSESSPQRIWADVEPEFPQLGGVRLHVQLYVAENPDQLADDVDYVPDLPDRDEMTQRFSIKRTACSIGSRRRDQLGTFCSFKNLAILFRTTDFCRWTSEIDKSFVIIAAYWYLACLRASAVVPCLRSGQRVIQLNRKLLIDQLATLYIVHLFIAGLCTDLKHFM